MRAASRTAISPVATPPASPVNCSPSDCASAGSEHAMIEAQHLVLIEAPIENVWDYVQDIRQWANLFPGCREYKVLDERDSQWRSDEHTSELQSLIRISYAVFCLHNKKRVL